MEAEINSDQYIRVLQQIIGTLRKIGNDIIIEVSRDSFSLRSINSSNSALPIVKFNMGFFTRYTYQSSLSQIVYSLPANALLLAFKKITSPNSLILTLQEENKDFTLTIKDKFFIEHNWELYISDSALLDAVYTLDSNWTKIIVDVKIFDHLTESFRGISNLYIEVHKEGKNCLVLKSSPLEETSNSSQLSIGRSPKCEVIIPSGVSDISVSVNLADFVTAIKLSKFLSNSFEFYLVGPSFPIIVKATSQSRIDFEMALATESDGAPPTQNEESIESRASVDNQWSNRTESTTISNTNMSNMSNMSGRSNFNSHNFVSNSINSKSSESSYRETPNSPPYPNIPNNNNSSPNSLEPNRSQSRINSQRSEELIKKLFEESPPFPFRRKFTGEVVNASQPSESDDFED